MAHVDTEVAKTDGGLMDDVLNIFVSPSTVFERNRNASFVMPALVQMILLTAVAFALKNLISPFFDAEFSRSVAQAAAKGQPMPEAAISMGRKMAGYTFFAIPLIGPWMTGIFGGLFTWIGARIVGAKITFGQSATIASWSAFPGVLSFITMAVFGVMSDSTTVRGISDSQLGPARFIDPMTAPPVLLPLFQSLDLFSIWTVVLVGIGVAVMGRVSRGSGFVAGIIKWGIGALIAIVPIALRG